MNRTTITTLTFAVGAAAITGLYPEGRASAQQPQQATAYTLVSVGGSSLPLLMDEEDGCREELISATLTLRPDGVWSLVGTERETCGADVDSEEEKEEGRYVVEGSAVRFSDEDGDEDDADEAADDADDDDGAEREIDDLSVGTTSPTGMTVRLRDGRTDLVFRR